MNSPVEIDKNIAKHSEDLARAELAVKKARAILEHAEKSYDGWQRWYLVPGGHIHRNRGCHSIGVRTQVVWLTELSGQSIDEIVAQYGDDVCTHCCPEAPVCGWSKSSREEAAAKAAKAAEKKRVIFA